MINIDTFSGDIKEISNKMVTTGEYSIEITLTDECNFRCEYCFEGDMCSRKTSLSSEDTIMESIDRMLEDEWFSSTFKGVRIGFWGGEPTLRPDLLKKFSDYYKNTPCVKFHIYTNGYNVDGIMDAFSGCKDKISVQVSYDGDIIHDLKRVSKSGDKTSVRVKNNIYKLYENGFNVSLKSTVTCDTLKFMPDAWEDINKIYCDLGEGINYSPTVDYISDSDSINIKEAKNVFIELAKKELKFYEKNGSFLFTWFNSKEPVKCNFFKYGMAINTNGDMLYCHGCEYSDSSCKMKFGNISDFDVINKIKHNHEYFEVPKKIDACVGCIATQCCTCNVVKYEKSSKEGFLDRWWDLSCQKNQCDMFKEFGKVSVSLMDIIRRK